MSSSHTSIICIKHLAKIGLFLTNTNIKLFTLLKCRLLRVLRYLIISLKHYIISKTNGHLRRSQAILQVGPLAYTNISSPSSLLHLLHSSSLLSTPLHRIKAGLRESLTGAVDSDPSQVSKL